MADLYVVRRPKRVGLFLETEGTGKNPHLMFFLPGMSRGQLDQKAREELAKQGITKEADVNKIMETAEKRYETRLKIDEVNAEFNRLMEIRRNGGKIMQMGHRKWKQVFHPAIKRFKEA